MAMDYKVTHAAAPRTQSWFDELDDAIAYAESEAFKWVQEGSICSPEYRVVYNPSGSVQRYIRSCDMDHMLNEHNQPVRVIAKAPDGSHALVKNGEEYEIGYILDRKRFEMKVAYGSLAAARRAWPYPGA